MEKKYYPTIGLEVHAELNTKTKMFCGCKNDPDEEKPNVNICPVCMAHPGALPVINKKALDHVIKVGLAVDGKIADFTERIIFTRIFRKATKYRNTSIR